MRSQVHATRKKPYISRVYKCLAINLCRLALGGQTVKNLLRLVYEFELDRCKSTQIGGQTKRNETKTKRNETQVLHKLKTCVDLRVRLARAYRTVSTTLVHFVLQIKWIFPLRVLVQKQNLNLGYKVLFTSCCRQRRSTRGQGRQHVWWKVRHQSKWGAYIQRSPSWSNRLAQEKLS